MALRGVSCCLVLALAGWLPVTVRAGSTEEAEGGVSISTSPAGASVFVDGRLRGQSPLEIGALLVGDHRVKLVKDGYLENSRVLVVEADGTTDLDVTLTEATAGAGSAVQLGGGGGGGSIWSNPLFWAAVGGGAGAAIYLAVRDSNKAPTAGDITRSCGSAV